MDTVEQLYDELGSGLYRYAAMLLADASAAEDVVQQVFVAFLKRRSHVQNVPHYLRRSVRNECYSLMRNRREVQGDSDYLEIAAPDASLPERLMLQKALGSLPIEQREVIHLHVYEGLTFREVAESTDESINTVASRYRYAIATLRRLTKG